MSNSNEAHFDRSLPLALNANGGFKWIAAIVLAVWFALVMSLGGAGAFVTPPGQPPLAIGLGFGVPLVLFFAALGVSRAFREFVRALDVRVMLGVQAWRAGGLGFLALYTYGVLPGAFALPAGLGDIAIGVTAPWLLLAVIRQPRFIASKTFAVWNALGILDLVVAVGSGTLTSALATGAAGEVTTAPMALLPLVVIPAYLVPIFIMLHVAALMQARRVAAEIRS
ncbi:MAG: hypothetical protein ACJ8LN_08390 [Sulfurifustis sp.]